MSTERTQTIDETASAWLMQRDSGRWTEADQARFEQWLQASTANRVAFLRLELGWEDARRLKALGAGIASDEPPPPGQWNLTPFFDPAKRAAAKSSKRMPKHRRLFVMAASIFLALFGVWKLWPAGQVYQTPLGGVSSVPMADGSKVTLNTDSAIRVALSDTERRIELKHGEAFFEVAKDPQRPFIVVAGGTRVVVVGTKFSVRRIGGSNEFKVVVTEGKVRIEDGSPQAQPLLIAGSIARTTQTGVLVQTGTALQAEEQLSWRSGVLMFRNQTLADAVTEFNRYNARKFVIDDPGIASLKIEGNFRSTNIDAFARLLEQVYPVDVELSDGDKMAIKAR